MSQMKTKLKNAVLSLGHTAQRQRLTRNVEMKDNDTHWSHIKDTNFRSLFDIPATMTDLEIDDDLKVWGVQYEGLF